MTTMMKLLEDPGMTKTCAQEERGKGREHTSETKRKQYFVYSHAISYIE